MNNNQINNLIFRYPDPIYNNKLFIKKFDYNLIDNNPHAIMIGRREAGITWIKQKSLIDIEAELRYGGNKFSY